MQKIVVALALLLAASTVSYAQVKPTKINTVEFSDGASVAVSGANKARLRYHLGNNRLEVSYNGGAYAALGGGGGGGTLQDAYDASASPVRITESNANGALILRANAAAVSPLFIENNAGATRFEFAASGSLTMSDYLYAAGLGGTYTLSGTPTLGSDLTGSAGVDISLAADGVLTAGRLSVTGTTTANSIVSNVADGAAAVAHVLDTTPAYTTTGAKLLSLRTNGAEFWSIAKSAFGWAINAPSSRFIEFNSGGGYRAGSGSYYFAENWNIAGGLEMIVNGVNYYATTTAFRTSADVAATLGASSQRWTSSWQRIAVVGDTSANKPACDSTSRGAMFLTRATAGNADTFEVCMKAAADTYAWRTIFTAP